MFYSIIIRLLLGPSNKMANNNTSFRVEEEFVKEESYDRVERGEGGNVGVYADVKEISNIAMRLSGTVVDLCEKRAAKADGTESRKVVYTSPAPVMRRYSGKEGVDYLPLWEREARDCMATMRLEGQEAVDYLCRFVDYPALARVKNSGVMDAEQLFGCLEIAFGRELDYLEMEDRFRSRVQQPGENVWEFADVLSEMEARMQKMRPKGDYERAVMLGERFCRNLKDRRIGVKVDRWRQQEGCLSWQRLVQEVDDRVKLEEQIQREELQWKKNVQDTGVVRQNQTPGSKVPVCVLCGKEGHRGFQCSRFKVQQASPAGNDRS